ncbi:DUF4118 domain-containing protein [Aestuariimicrobium kwangyangense]|uniref:DUF4118 domain-containing protein n=1 Tax=Aestuariimicrobium kwangyangense TaxID=396389 RepID=UPI00146A4B4B|nr:DUF4118 domain-containing protein [Aestuariimicrobium kwangyangense]
MNGRVSMWPATTWWRPAVRVTAVVAPLLTAMLLSTIRDRVTAATAVLALVVWVVAAAATGDRVAGVLAAVSSGAWYDFFLTAPHLRFTIAKADDIEATTLLVLISLVVGEVALWGYRQQRRASEQAGYLEGVLGAARAVAAGSAEPDALVEVVARQIGTILVADGCRYVDGPVGDSRIAVLDHDGGLTRNGEPVDVDAAGLPDDEYVAVPVHLGNRVVGHFLLTATARPSYPTLEQRRVAVLLADQVAAAHP